MTNEAVAGRIREVLCDVCGRDNPDRLLYCQDCGKRLKAPAHKSPPEEVSARAPGSADAPPGRSRPEAPPFPSRPPEARTSIGSAPPPRRSAPPPERESARASVAPPALSPCGHCGAQNPPGYRFCGVCGQNLPGTSPPSRARPSQVPGPILPAPVVPIAEPVVATPPSLVCNRCQGHNDHGARFCKYCGNGLVNPRTDPGPVQPSAAPNPQQAPVFAPAQPATFGAGYPPRERSPGPGAQPLAPVDAAPQPVQVAAVRVDQPAIVRPPDPTPVLVAAPSGQFRPNGTALIPRTEGPAAPIQAVGIAAAVPVAAPIPAAVPIAAPVAGALPVSSTSDRTGPHPLVQPSVIAQKLRDHRPTPEIAVTAEPGRAPQRPIAGDTVDTRGPRPESRPVTGRLVVVVEDGSDGKAFELRAPEAIIGRVGGEVLLFDDPYVSPEHAKLTERDGKWFIQDLRSVNGVYLRLKARKVLEARDLILLGSQVLQFQTVSDEERRETPASQHGTRVFGTKPVDRLARLDQRSVAGTVADVFYLTRDETILGRETGDIVFTSDAFLSRRHALIRRDPVANRFYLEDLDSSNGTYLAIRKETVLTSGDRIRVGQHLFRFETAS